MTQEAFDALRESQHNTCAICEREFTDDRAPVIDHDHATGRVRGLLCGPCNRGIGLLADDPERVARAAMYLEA